MRNRRRTEERFFKILMAAATWGIVFTFLLIVFIIFRKGLPALSWQMITRTPSEGYYFGRGGGILNAIAGSFYLATGATVLAMLTGLPVALFINTYLVSYKNVTFVIRLILDTLWGIPSIVYGAFGFMIMLQLKLRPSLLAGILTVSLVIAPIIIRAFDEALRAIPRGLLETAYALGSTRAEIAFKVFLRQALPGLITALLLGFGRGIGDAASVLFTAGYTDYVPVSISDPAATLPLAIFFQLSSPIPEVRQRAYAAAVVLTAIILLISLLARFLMRKSSLHII